MEAYGLFWKWPAAQAGPHTAGQRGRVCSQVWLERRGGLGSAGQQCWISSAKPDYGGHYRPGGRFMSHKRREIRMCCVLDKNVGA